MGVSISSASSVAIDSPCEREHNNPDSLDARLFPSVVLAVAPAVTMDKASSLSVGWAGTEISSALGLGGVARSILDSTVAIARTGAETGSASELGSTSELRVKVNPTAKRVDPADTEEGSAFGLGDNAVCLNFN